MPPRYEDELRTRLGQNRLPVTVGQYIQRLRVLNGGKPLTSMKFLMDFDAVTTRIDGLDKAASTKTSYYTAVCAVLSMFPKYSALHGKYITKTMQGVKALKEELGTNQRNDKQVETILPMAQILKRREELRKEFAAAKAITAKVWERYTGFVLLCLYTMQPPRRNRDFSLMMIVSKADQASDPRKNYFVRNDAEMIFRNYKTATTYGEQRVKVAPELMKVLDEYVANYKLVAPSATEPMPLLIHFDGEPLSATNGITRILNKVIGKGVGSSALRHIYLSEKFGDTLKEMKEVAEDMAHDMGTQRDYIKHD
jgi:integrase